MGEEIRDLVIRIDERVKGLDGKIDTVIDHNEKQNGWIKKHTEAIEKNSNDITAIKSKKEGKREFILLVLWLVSIVGGIGGVLAFVK